MCLFSVPFHHERFCTEQHARQQSNFYFIIILMLVGKYSKKLNKSRPVAFQHPTTAISGVHYQEVEPGLHSHWRSSDFQIEHLLLKISVCKDYLSFLFHNNHINTLLGIKQPQFVTVVTLYVVYLWQFLSLYVVVGLLSSIV